MNKIQDNNFNFDSDEEVSKKHADLLKSVARLDNKSQNVRKPERSEPTLEVSEFNLVKSGIADNDAVRINDLVESLGGNVHHREINKKFNLTKKQIHLLPKPLEKQAAEKLRREVGFEKTQVELTQWDAVVTKNRVAEKLIFPLRKTVDLIESSDKYIQKFRVQSDLEKNLAILEPQKNENIVENFDKYPLTLREMQEKRREFAKFRAQQSYKHAKANRIKKIKSKKFHRIEKKMKTKQQLKEFEELRESDPQAALEKLELLDKARAVERMSLRHKSVGKWAQNKQIRAKYDRESRQALAQQLAISRELTEKINKNDDSSDENDDNNEMSYINPQTDQNNPWINSVKTEKEINNFVSDYRKYSEKKNKFNNKIKENNIDKTNITLNEKTMDFEYIKNPDAFNPVEKVIEESTKINQIDNNSLKTKLKSLKSKNKKIKVGTSEWCVEFVDIHENKSQKKVNQSVKLDEIFNDMDRKLQEKFITKINDLKRKLKEDSNGNKQKENKKKFKNESLDLSFKKIANHPEFNDALDEVVEEFQNKSVNDITQKQQKNFNTSMVTILDKNNLEIDPSQFITVEPRHIKTKLPNEIGDEDDADANEDQKNIISDAFADDDVVDEFKKEKEQEMNKSQSADINATIPGWGSWGGKNIKIPKRNKNRLLIKTPEQPHRKDKNKENIIIIEENNSKLEQHLVNDLPYPFASVADFESTIRAPAGRNFVPENVHKYLIEPAVKTRIGKIIEPMDETFLLNVKNPLPIRKKARKFVKTNKQMNYK